MLGIHVIEDLGWTGLQAVDPADKPAIARKRLRVGLASGAVGALSGYYIGYVAGGKKLGPGTLFGALAGTTVAGVLGYVIARKVWPSVEFSPVVDVRTGEKSKEGGPIYIKPSGAGEWDPEALGPDWIIMDDIDGICRERYTGEERPCPRKVA